MTSWELLIDEAAIASVLPEGYARYRRPIKGALIVFLEGLPEAHQVAVLGDQAALSPTATVSERFARLARSCPALHKLGQTLARDQRLSPELRLHLQQLESLPPSLPLPAIRELLVRELGPLDRLGVSLASSALAEGSVAVVVPFRHDGAARSEAHEGVFKILKPGIEERLERELALVARVGSYLDEQCEELAIPRVDYREAFEGLADKLRQEVRLDGEQRHLEIAHAAYAAEPRVHIPALFDFRTSRVTAMERVYGEKVTDHRFADLDDKRRCAELVVTALLARPVLSTADDALFHGDPHAGNLLLTRDERLAILDWSLATTLGEEKRIAFMQIAIGALTLDRERIADALDALAGRQGIEPQAVKPIIEGAFGRIRQGQLPGLIWVTELLDAVAQTARPRFGSDLMLLRKTLHALEGVVADIGADRRCIDGVMLGEFFAQVAREWPARWLATPDSRVFGTRLSNADLAEVMLRIPFAATRAWLDQGLDALRRSGAS